MDQLAHTNRSGVEMTSFLIITESLGPEVFGVGASQPFCISGTHWDDTASHTLIVFYKQATATVDRRGNGNQNIYIRSLDSCTEVLRGGFRRSINDEIGMNPTGAI